MVPLRLFWSWIFDAITIAKLLKTTIPLVAIYKACVNVFHVVWSRHVRSGWFCWTRTDERATIMYNFTFRALWQPLHIQTANKGALHYSVFRCRNCVERGYKCSWCTYLGLCTDDVNAECPGESIQPIQVHNKTDSVEALLNCIWHEFYFRLSFVRLV